MMLWCQLLVMLTALAAVPANHQIPFSATDPEDSAKNPPPFDPTDGYEVRRIEGWPVRINGDFLASDPVLCHRTLEQLRFQLYQICRVVPAPAVEKLRTITIWVEKDEPHHPCMAYHPDAGWLREHEMNPDKAKCVEIAGARTFLDWTHEQPWMVLHELAHGYHDQFLGGYDNAEIKAVFEQAGREKLFQLVLHWDAKTVRAYAANNPMEYFAESTEAFFGTNDYYPFVRAELKVHDPRMHNLLIQLWGVPRSDPGAAEQLQGQADARSPRGRRWTEGGLEENFPESPIFF